jgi:hypothetical protein
MRRCAVAQRQQLQVRGEAGPVDGMREGLLCKKRRSATGQWDDKRRGPAWWPKAEVEVRCGARISAGDRARREVPRPSRLGKASGSHGSCSFP